MNILIAAHVGGGLAEVFRGADKEKKSVAGEEDGAEDCERCELTRNLQALKVAHLQAIEDLRNGKCIIVADDEDRENEGDLVCAAELATPDVINFMALHGRGLICLTLTPERCEQLGLAQMAVENTEAMGTAFTISIDAERRFG
ncbi:MAG: 3,4-dihydroxy-2-butanone-4-phosphate synthase, partial [Rhodospirillales bacterium]|nr:3,4-dihydroxy-2-butanone-4-phosphate synthase [Rhodospirillales bacterium]